MSYLLIYGRPHLHFRRYFFSEIMMIEDPPAAAVEKASSLIDRKDGAILAAAIEAKVDYLITLDKKHFLKQRTQRNILIEVCTPADFIRTSERLWLQE
jgi:predicted nucleic acid-binding protein